MDRAQLVQALYDADREIGMYRELLQKAEQAKARIQRELDTSFCPANSGFSREQVSEARRGILQVLAQHKSMNVFLVPPRVITDALAEIPSDLVLRELHKLARDTRSDVLWNGRKGPASRYGRA